MSTELESFDYGLLKPAEREAVQEHTGEIRSLARRAAEDVVEIGQRLTEVKGVLGHGQFGTWVNCEFGWSYPAAARFMQVAEAFKSINLRDLQIAPSALYALASGSTPEPIRQEFIQRAEAGEPIARKDVLARVQEHHEQFMPEPLPAPVLPVPAEPANNAAMSPKPKPPRPTYTPPVYQGVEEMEMGDGTIINIPILPKSPTRDELDNHKPQKAAERFENVAAKALAALTALDGYSLEDLRQITESPEGRQRFAPVRIARLKEMVDILHAKWSDAPQKPTIDQEPLLRADKTLTLDAMN